MLAATPRPPYYAVIFTSLLRPEAPGYAEAADRMFALVQAVPGYLGAEHARDGVGITVAYFTDEEAIAAWREHPDHTATRARGRAEWYSAFTVRVARVEREYGFHRS